MADLFGQLLGVANQRQAGQMQGQKTLQDLSLELAQQQQAAKQRSLAEALRQAQMRKLAVETEKTQYDLDHPKPQPYQPTSFNETVRLAGEKAKAEAKYRPASGSEPHWQVIQTDNGTFQINPKTGQMRPVNFPGGEQVTKPLTPAQKKSIATNTTTVSTVDKALKALKGHPDAVGLKRGWNDLIDQHFDEEGVDARALIANVGSQIVHDRSGAAVTVSEYPRLAPFVPSIHDSQETAAKKLRQLRAAIAQETELLGGHIADEDAVDGATAAPVDPVLAKFGITAKAKR